MAVSFSAPLRRLRQLKPAHLMLGLGLLGLGARVLVIVESLGSNDIRSWQHFAQLVSEHGLGYVYDTQPLFNHPPLMGLLGALIHRIAADTGAPFAMLFKLPELLADIGSAALLWWMWRHKSARYAAMVFALFCWSPVAILVGAYHGNTDSLCAACLLASALAVDARRPLLGGLALAASINVKLIPVIAIPLLLSCTRGSRQALRFSLGVSLGALPFIPILVTHWQAFSSHVLGYRAYPGWWGTTALMQALATDPRLADSMSRLIGTWTTVGTASILLLPCVVAMVNGRNRSPHTARELAAWGIAFFLAVAPGWGIQYIVYLVPVLFAVNVERAVTYSMVAGAYALVTYFAFWTGERPFFSLFRQVHPSGVLAMAYLAWMVTIRTAIDLWRRERRPPALVPGALASRKPGRGRGKRTPAAEPQRPGLVDAGG